MAGPVTRGLVAAALLLLGSQAVAHQLNVFAWVNGAEVLVEAKFSNGRVPQIGTVRVFDAQENLVETLTIDEDGTARFPIAGAEDGLRIEIETGEGHEDYWILTPDDLAQ